MNESLVVYAIRPTPTDHGAAKARQKSHMCLWVLALVCNPCYSLPVVEVRLDDFLLYNYAEVKKCRMLW